MDGGGQERSFRSGTLPTPLCVGLGSACALAAVDMHQEAARLRELRDRLLRAIVAEVPQAVVNGDFEQRIAGNLNLAFPDVEGEVLLIRLKDIALSTGSACTSAAIEPSYVLRAMGLDAALAQASLRIGLGRFTTEAEVDYAAGRIVDEVRRLRNEGGFGIGDNRLAKAAP
jgi:cysteine desulfurase